MCNTVNLLRANYIIIPYTCLLKGSITEMLTLLDYSFGII